MSYTAEHKAQTRSRIVAAARTLFNRRGFSEVSIDEIMQAAGLTRGGFYNHFARKGELYAEAIRHVLTCDCQPAVGATAAQQIAAAYLSDRHLSDVDGSCPLIAFSSDAARGGEALKGAYREVFSSLVGMLQSTLGACDDARTRAVTMATLCVGAMMVARAIDDPVLRVEIRRTALNQALAVGGFDCEAEDREAAFRRPRLSAGASAVGRSIRAKDQSA